MPEDWVAFLAGDWFFVVFAMIVVYQLSRVVRAGGFKNLLFGGRDRNEIGAVDGLGTMGMRSALKVHSLVHGKSGEPVVGVEVVHKSLLSYSMQPVTLSQSDARALAQLLERAAGEGR